MLSLIERKAAGEEISTAPEAEEPAAAPDLMAALEASLAAMRPDEEDPAPAPKARKRGAGTDGAKPSRQPAKAKR